VRSPFTDGKYASGIFGNDIIGYASIIANSLRLNLLQ